MQEVKLKITFIDSFIYLIKSTWVAGIIGIGLVVYLGRVDLNGIVNFLPIVFGMMVFVSFIVSFITLATVNEQGISNKKITISWNEEMEVRLIKIGYPGWIQISTKDRKGNFSVYNKVFSYPEVSEVTQKNSPQNHPLREHCS